MKLMLLVLGLLVCTNLVFAKPTKTKENETDADEEMQNDDYGDNDNDYDDDVDEDDVTSLPPEILSEPLQLRGNAGETVWLPCDCRNADSFVVLWKKNGSLIFQDKIPTGNKEPRYTIFSNRTVKISKLVPNDTGNYECSISTGDQEIKVVHKLELYTPPKIVKLIPSGKHEVMIGTVLELVCEASGIPEPTITWAKSGNRVVTKMGSFDGPSVTFESVQKDNTGVYQCLADNHIGDPTSAAVEIVVLYPPTIKIEKLTVNSAEDYESQLTCIVHGMPKPAVSWQKNSETIEADSNVKIMNEGNKHILRILRTKKSDFGNYTCVAENRVGHAAKEIILSGKPTPAEFVSAKAMDDGKEVNVQFKVESNSPITEYQLQYRLKGKNESWKTETPKVTNSDGNVYTVNHVLKELEPAVYEVKLRSKNTYGWSHYSHHKTFDTQEEDKENLVNPENQEEPQNLSHSGSQTLSTLVPLLVLSVFSIYV